ncbi:MAG: FliH/SctL family protein [Vicinamibacterales bacterium]
MSYKARRVSADVPVAPFAWGGPQLPAAPAVVPARPPVAPTGPIEVAEAPPAEPARDLAAIEREAFSSGFGAGERAGLEAGQQRADAMLRRLAQTLDEVARLRKDIMEQTERQLVQLSLAIARRIVRREITMDAEFVAALVHVAFERLGLRVGPATIRLHPEEHRLVFPERVIDWEAAHFQVVPDASLPRGGCVIESDLGSIDAGIDAQFDEMAKALLGSDPTHHERPAA